MIDGAGARGKERRPLNGQVREAWETVSGSVFNIMRFAVNDGPGIRTTVFLKGCPLDCWWCHNPEGQRPEPELVFWPGRCIGCGRCVEVCPTGAAGAVAPGSPPPAGAGACIACGRCAEACPSQARELTGRVMSAGEVLGEIARDTIFYDESGGGVTFSGGEPLAQPEFLAALLRGCRERGLRTCVDTSGLAPAATLSELAAGVDLFLYDVKLMDPERHLRFTGADNELILANLRMLLRAGRRVTVRIPVVTGVNDDPANIDATGRFLASQAVAPDVVLLPYHRTGEDKYVRLGRPYRLEGTAAPGAGGIGELAARLRGFGLEVQAGG